MINVWMGCSTVLCVALTNDRFGQHKKINILEWKDKTNQKPFCFVWKNLVYRMLVNGSCGDITVVCWFDLRDFSCVSVSSILLLLFILTVTGAERPNLFFHYFEDHRFVHPKYPSCIPFQPDQNLAIVRYLGSCRTEGNGLVRRLFGPCILVWVHFYSNKA